MWINQIPCYLLMVAHLFILNQFVYSEERGSSYSAQNLTCITHNLDKVDCTWTTNAGDNSELTYEFCYSDSSSLPQCSFAKEKKGTFGLIVFDNVHIEITAFNSAEERKNPLARKTFVLSEKDILFVPPMPHIHKLTPDYIADTSILEWNDGGSAFPYQIDSSWQIQILRKDPMEEIALEFYNKSVGNNDMLHRWEWTSDLPFNCTTHYFRIRCFLNEKNFAGRKMWSEWSPLVNISGRKLDKFARMYPLDKVVAKGSNVTFCCMHQPGYTLISINYSSCTRQSLNCEIAPLTKLSKTLFVQNVITREPYSNVNAWCELREERTHKRTIAGTVLFVGYPPGVPQNLSCETQNYKEIKCQWEEKRYTLFCDSRRTQYSLFESNSGLNVSCTNGCKEYRCNFTLLKDQTEYNFTLHASSHLGQAEASIVFDIRHRVYPYTPTDLKVSSVTSSSFKLSFLLPGNFKETKLQCQVQLSYGTSKEKRNEFLDHSGNSRYTILVNKLCPFTKYCFQVRCATPKPFLWKWSDWSTKKSQTTQQARPAKALDIWRERDANEDTVTLFWKPLSVFESNGLIEAYEVCWTLPDKSTKNESVPASHNSTKINLGKNDYIFTVKAKNKAGVSPPATISSAELPEGDISTEKGIGKDDSISFAWPPDSNVTCGYVVRWCYSPEPCTDVHWEKFSSSVTNADIKSGVFQPGVRYTFSVFGCKENGYQRLGNIKGYIQELSPKTAPDFTVQHTTSDSIVIKWKNISVEDSRGFIKGYLLKCAKGDGPTPKYFKPEINVTNLNQDLLTVSGLQGKTSYHLTFRAYTAAGSGPVNTLNVVTKENALGLIIAIIIPVSVVLVLAVVTGILCYRKREWIKEVFYPDIPNPEHSKALDFPKDSEGNSNSKTLEMNPCTPNNIEVVETQSQGLKIEDTAITSPDMEDAPEDGLESESGSHVVVSYCPPIIEEVISNPPEDESAGSSQVVYIDVQSMYSAPVKPSEELEADCVVSAGYKPQMQLAVNSFRQLEETSATEEDSDKGAGYRPQVNASSWNTDIPDSPESTGNVSFGSPCSINSRQFLIPPKDEDDDSPKAINSGWSFANLFHTKSNE
ncbi:leukemia inhibitory factor receptor [Erythrolamprus reginae]|uniref:leukemia inhibitory factor receptor n=1 Tax=Erythrolamprus reginae TaxID=121349 RepID=UPI00396CA1CD